MTESENPWTRILNSLRSSNKYLPLKFDSAWFEGMDFSIYDHSCRTEIEALKSWFEEQNLENLPGLVLSGSTGIGKTHILAACAKILAWRVWWQGGGVLRGAIGFWPYNDLCSVLRQDPTDFELVKNIRSPKFLFIDDMGATKSSEFLEGQVLGILDYRTSNDLPTFISTNLSGEDIKRQLGERLASRIKESCLWLEVKAESDFRNKKFLANKSRFKDHVRKFKNYG